MARVDCFDWEYDRKGSLTIKDLNSERDLFKKDKVINLTLGATPNVYVNKEKPKGEWIEKDNVFPPIIDKETFDKVQDRFRKLAKRKWLRSNSNRYLMGGALLCDTCGNNLFGHRVPDVLKSGDPIHYEYYRCSGDVKKGSHGRSARPMIRRGVVDDVVINGILKRAAAIADPENVRELFKERLQRFGSSRPDRIVTVENEIQKIDSEVGRMMEAFVKWGHAVDESQMKELKRHKTALESEKQSLIESGKGELHFDIEREATDAMQTASEIKAMIESKKGANMLAVRDDFLDSSRVKWSGDGGRPVLELDWLEVPKFVEKRITSSSTFL